MTLAAAATYSRAKASKRDDSSSLESNLWYSVGLDVRSLATFRIIASVAMFVDILWRLPELHEHYGPRGVMHIETAALMVDETPLRFLTTPMGEMYYPHVFALSIFFSITLFVGLYSRLSCFLAWLCMMEYQNRNDILNDYGDAMLRNFLLLASFLPIGEVFSLDALFKSDSELAEIVPPKRRSQPTVTAAASTDKTGAEAKAADTEDKKEVPVLPIPVVKSLAVVSLAGAACWAHVIMEYVCTAHLKSGSHWHAKDEGNAVYYAVGDERLSLPMGRWVVEITPHWVMNLFIDLVLGWEYVGPILVLLGRPAIRTISCLLFIFMHLNFCTFINLGPLFSLTCPAMWALLIPAWLWDTLASFFRIPVGSDSDEEEDEAADENGAVKALHPADSALAYVRSDQKLLRLALRVFSVFFFSPLTIPLNDFAPVVAAATAAGKAKAVNNKTKVALFAYGTVLTDYEAFAHLLRLSAVPLLPRIADSALSDKSTFGKFGRTLFQTLSKDTSAPASNAISDQVTYGRKKRRNAIKSVFGALRAVLTAFFFVYIVLSNLDSIEFFEDTVPYPDKAEGETRVWFKMPEWLENAGGFFRLQQSWSMYAPNVDRDNGWFVFLGKYPNGTQAKLDVWSLEPPILTPPKVVYDTYKTFRWNEYLITYYDKVEDFLDDEPAEDTNWFLEDFGEFLCNRYRKHLGLPEKFLPPKKSKDEFRNRFKIPQPRKINGTYKFPYVPPTPAMEHPDMISHVFVHYMLLRTPVPFEKREGKNWNVLKYKCYGY